MEEPIIRDPVAIFLVVIAVIMVAPMLLERFRMPGIVGLILAGMAIGPHSLHLISNEYAIGTLAAVGLVYLMFSAGLEIDLRQFRRVRGRAATFGLLTFVLPSLAGLGVGLRLDMDWNSAVLLGAVIASHALINYPLLSRLGIMRIESISVTIGATLFTDIAALVVLAVVVRANSGGMTVAGVVLQVILATAYVLLVLLALPRLGKEFFRRNTRVTVEFQFALVVLFTASLLAEAIQLHAIIGAFLAGFAVNSTLPSEGAVTRRILFMGESFFIPIFLLSIGMMLDPSALFAGSEALTVGLLLTAAVLVSKLAAAWAAAFLFHYGRNELMTMWGISQAQATTTLAVLLVGAESGLLTRDVFNGGVLMVLFTCITSPLLVQWFGSRLEAGAEPREAASLFDRIVVSVANAETQEHLIDLAGILSRSAGGELIALHVAPEEGDDPGALEDRRRVLDSETLEEPDAGLRKVLRVESPVAKGILHVAAESDATLVVLGWSGRSKLQNIIFGTVTDQVIKEARVPLIVGRITAPANSLKRIILVVPSVHADQEVLEGLTEAAGSISRVLKVPLMVLAAEEHLEPQRTIVEQAGLDQLQGVFKLSRNAVKDVAARCGPRDLVIVATSPGFLRFRSKVSRFAERLAGEAPSSLVVVSFPR